MTAHLSVLQYSGDSTFVKNPAHSSSRSGDTHGFPRFLLRPAGYGGRVARDFPCMSPNISAGPYSGSPFSTLWKSFTW